MITIYLLLVPGAKHVLERHAIKFFILIIGLGFKRVHKVSIVGYTRYTAAYKRIAECFRTRDIFSMWFTVWSFGVPTIIFYYAHHTDYCGPSYRFLPLFQLLSARLCDEAVPTLYCSSVITLAVMVRIAVKSVVFANRRSGWVASRRSRMGDQRPSRFILWWYSDSVLLTIPPPRVPVHAKHVITLYEIHLLHRYYRYA